MERGTTITWLRAAGAVLAAAAGLSCGAGIHGDVGWYHVSQTVDKDGGKLTLREGTLIVYQNCVTEPTPIILRRHDSIDHKGAIGPVFEIELPSANTFVNDAQINIATSAAVANDDSSVIGFIVENRDGSKQWVPDTPPYTLDCPESSVCGPVQAGSFSNPSGDADPAKTVEFAIIKKCGARQECPSKQTCSSGACQWCSAQLGGDCNP
jgi:hypothetical protein